VGVYSDRDQRCSWTEGGEGLGRGARVTEESNGRKNFYFKGKQNVFFWAKEVLSY
jgi:hypothetical protein